MDKYNWYYGLLVEESHMDNAFQWAEEADRKQNDDSAGVGIMVPRHALSGPWPSNEDLSDGGAAVDSWSPRENAPPDWSLLVDTGYAYDKDGRRLAVDPPTTVLVDCQNDYLGTPNAVAAGNGRYVSLFLKYVEALSDPQVDDHGSTVYFQVAESYEIEVRQGPEEAYPPVTRPALDSTAILIADVLVDNTMPPINDADLDFSRTEYLVNQDVSLFMGASMGPTNSRIMARNLTELAWNMFLMMQYVSVPLFGSSTISGQLTPDAACSYDLGKSGQEWKELFVQAVTEIPDYTTSGRSDVQPDPDWMQNGEREGNVIKRVMDSFGLFASEDMDAHGRRDFRYLRYRDDFLYGNTWAGVPDYLTTLVGTGAVTPNPSPFAQGLPGGHLELDCPGAGDSAQVYRDAYPLHCDYSPTCQYGFYAYSGLSSGQEVVLFGIADPLNVSFAYLVYDPAGVVNPGAPTPNWWIWFNDGLSPVLWTDTGIPYVQDAYHDAKVAFTRDSAALGSTLWLRAHLDKSMIYELDLTTGGYEPQVILAAWDYRFSLDDLLGGTKLHVDYVEERQGRDL